MLSWWAFDAVLDNPDGPATRHRRATPSPSDVAEVVSRHLDPDGRFTVRKRAVTVSAHGTDPWQCELSGVLVLPAGVQLPARVESQTSAGRRVRIGFGPITEDRVRIVLEGR